MKEKTGVVRFALRVLFVLPVKLLAGVVETAFRAGVAVGKVPARASRRAVRIAGVKGVVLFVLGAVVAVLVTPVTGRQLRSRLFALAAGGGKPSDADLEAAVVAELGHAPRTWHLDQPDVRVRQGVVTLSGAVPHQTARDELVTVAGGIPGVVDVDDQLRVDDAAAIDLTDDSDA